MRMPGTPAARSAPTYRGCAALSQITDYSLGALVDTLFVRPLIVGCLALLVVGSRAAAEDVGRFRNDWTGNTIVVEAVPDPKVQGVSCHISRFSRSLIDRLSKGNWFIDPSNSSIACRQTGPVTVGDISTSASGEEVFPSGSASSSSRWRCAASATRKTPLWSMSSTAGR
jgi:CreA protein